MAWAILNSDHSYCNSISYCSDWLAGQYTRVILLLVRTHITKHYRRFCCLHLRRGLLCRGTVTHMHFAHVKWSLYFKSLIWTVLYYILKVAQSNLWLRVALIHVMSYIYLEKYLFKCSYTIFGHALQRHWIANSKLAPSVQDDQSPVPTVILSSILHTCTSAEGIPKVLELTSQT